MKIRNLETGEVIDLNEVYGNHPDWVHQQCGTRNEGDLLDMFNQYDMAVMVQHIGEPDICGVFADDADLQDLLYTQEKLEQREQNSGARE